MPKVKDPVCGMVIESSTAAARGDFHGLTTYFCSSACKKSYERTHPPSG
ncbi:MAG: hypothetical protein WB788_00010 [Thermoplasmata archaeon]